MTDLHDAALRAGVFHVIAKEAAAAKDAAKAEIAAALPKGDAVAGRVGDEILCKASWSKGTTSTVVVDQDALLAWVKEHHPTEIVEERVVVTETVNQAYLKSLKVAGTNVIDSDGLVVPGVQVVTGKQSLSVRTEKNALDMVLALMAEGRVSLDSIKELPAADGDGYIEGEVVEG